MRHWKGKIFGPVSIFQEMQLVYILSEQRERKSFDPNEK